MYNAPCVSDCMWPRRSTSVIFTVATTTWTCVMWETFQCSNNINIFNPGSTWGGGGGSSSWVTPQSGDLVSETWTCTCWTGRGTPSGNGRRMEGSRWRTLLAWHLIRLISVLHHEGHTTSQEQGRHSDANQGKISRGENWYFWNIISRELSSAGASCHLLSLCVSNNIPCCPSRQYNIYFKTFSPNCSGFREAVGEQIITRTSLSPLNWRFPWRAQSKYLVYSAFLVGKKYTKMFTFFINHYWQVYLKISVYLEYRCMMHFEKYLVETL